MRWRRIAFWLGISTLALVVLALTWLWTADLGVLKPQLERFVTEKTGREFAIDGDLSIDLACRRNGPRIRSPSVGRVVLT